MIAARPRTSALASLVVAFVAAAASLAACGTTPAVGREPGSTVPTGTATSSPSPTRDSLKLAINIDAKTVSPYRKTVELDRGQTVVLVTRSDHDTSLTVTGPGIDRTDFIGRLTTISTTFVADVPGIILVKSTDPAATIARLTVG